MDLWSLISLQITLFILMMAGALLKKTGVIGEEGKKTLSDLCIKVVIPCNIFNSFLIDFTPGILKTRGHLLASAVILQVLCLLLNRFLYNGFEERRKKVLQYCTIVPMSGFLGNPIAEGIYSAVGVLYTSIFLIPMRIIMWSVGTSYFVAGEKTDPKKILKNVLTHPCLITGLRPPDLLLKPIQYLGNCNTALTMIIVGTILADVPLLSIFSKAAFAFSGLRLVLLPAAVFGLGLLLGLDNVSHGVSVLMTGMPAGATAAILAARYGSDAEFATKCVVLSTFISMITLPLWAHIVG